MFTSTSARIVSFAPIVGIFGIVLLMSARTAPPPQANCDCALVRLDDALCRADLVFEGTPLTVDTVYVQGGMENSSSSAIDHVAIRFQQERVLKGSASTKVFDIATTVDKNNCGFLFLPGMRYLVFARMENHILVTSRCTPTRNMDTMTRGFADSLNYVLSGQNWSMGATRDTPCR